MNARAGYGADSTGSTPGTPLTTRAQEQSLGHVDRREVPRNKKPRHASAEAFPFASPLLDHTAMQRYLMTT
jgi:hypothetical protein